MRRLLPAALCALVVACGGPAAVDAVKPAKRPEPELVDVAHTREFRGLWVATVSNLDWPSRPGLSVAEQRAELERMLDTMQELHLNALVFQVRPEGDALYRSEIDPWSRVLTGAQGEDPGWDPLAFVVDEAHARNIEVHAWFNPYRAGTVANRNDLAPNHVARTDPAHVHRYGEYLWADPGAKAVQDRAVNVVLDVARRYDIDGVHLDDYFYPYPDGRPFPDDLTWTAYVAGGGELSRDDWRRQNVDTVVQRIAEGLTVERPDVRFGISPFGIYRPGIPEGVRGLDQYTALYADPLKWIEQGWVDYLAPQLYWPTTQKAQAFGPLLQWWSSVAPQGRHIFAGHALYRLGEDAAWTADEIRQQIEYTRSVPTAPGQIWFRAEHLLERPEAQEILREAYPAPASTPPVASMARVPVAPPTVARQPGALRLDHPDRDAVRAWAVYAREDGAWTLERLVPASHDHVELPPGRYAVSAVGRHGVESQGVVVRVKVARQAAATID